MNKNILLLLLLIFTITTVSCNEKDITQNEESLFECSARAQCLYDAKVKSASSVGTNEVDTCKKVKELLLKWARSGHKGHSLSYGSCQCEIVKSE